MVYEGNARLFLVEAEGEVSPRQTILTKETLGNNLRRSDRSILSGWDDQVRAMNACREMKSPIELPVGSPHVHDLRRSFQRS
jgi:hypothetical protein